MTKYIKLFLLGLLILAPIGIYVWNFHDHSFSHDPSVWGGFGDYFGGIYSIIVTILAVYLANILSKQNDSRKRIRNAVEEISNQIQTIEKGKQIDVRRLNRLYRLTRDYMLFIPESLYISLTELGDNFIENKDNRNNIDKNLLSDVKKQLKRLYLE